MLQNCRKTLNEFEACALDCARGSDGVHHNELRISCLGAKGKGGRHALRFKMMHNQASRSRFKHRVSAGLLGVFSISDIGTDGWAATLHVSGVVTDSKDLV